MKKLRWTQRLAIQSGIEKGKSNAEIAREIGVHRATIGREVARNAKCRENYRAHNADLASWERQKEAMPKRFLVRFNGVEWLSTLNKRNQIYTYVSRTHLNALSHHSTEICYLRFKIYDFRFSTSDFRFPTSAFRFPTSDFRFDDSLFTPHDFLNGENISQTFSTDRNGRLLFNTFLNHENSFQEKHTFIPQVLKRGVFFFIQLPSVFSHPSFIQNSLNQKVKTIASNCFSFPTEKFPAAA